MTYFVNGGATEVVRGSTATGHGLREDGASIQIEIGRALGDVIGEIAVPSRDVSGSS